MPTLLNHTSPVALLCTLCIALLSGCQSQKVTSPATPPQVGQANSMPQNILNAPSSAHSNTHANTHANAPLPDYFLIEPTHLTKGHIFLKRTAEKVAKEKAAKNPTPPSNAAATTANVQPHMQSNIQRAQGTTPAAIATQTPPKLATLTAGSQPPPWGDLRKAQVSIHTEDKPFIDLVEHAVTSAKASAGPWHVQWKIKRENKALLYERFSLNTETNFDKFMTSLASFILNHRGIELNFQLFDSERILVISDVFTS